MNLDDRGRAAVANARALLAAMTADGVGRLHIATDGFEIFIGRAGEPDPMVPVSAVEPPTDVETSVPTAAIAAPHVGTLESIAAIGSFIAPGHEVARLRVLDTSHPILSDRGGRVTRACACVGELAEYGTVLVDMADAA